MTLSEIDARRRATPLFQQAIALEQRMTAAISLGTIHRHRLATLRAYIRAHLRTDNAREMATFLAQYDAAFEAEMLGAMRSAASRDTAEAPAMGEARPAQFALGKAA